MTFVDLQTCPQWAGCGSDFFTGATSLTTNTADGNVYYVFNGVPPSANASRVLLARLSETSQTFEYVGDVSDAQDTEDGPVYHVSVMVASGKSPGDVRIGWIDN